jgi:hypothetical protein
MRLPLYRAFHALLAFSFLFAADLALDVPARYFSMSPHSPHLDSRFAQAERLSGLETHETLIRTFQRLLSAMREIKVPVWLAHGSLLGWYWGHKILPWDTNLDVHIHYDDLRFLAAYHNMTVYKDGKDRPSAEYLLDINPNFLERSRENDPDNIIDARWIDMATGLSVDITAVSEVEKDSAKGVKYLYAKDGNHYRKDMVIPFIVSKFENEEVYIPRNSSAILAHKYGQESLQRTVYQGLVKVSLTGWILADRSLLLDTPLNLRRNNGRLSDQ